MSSNLYDADTVIVATDIRARMTDSSINDIELGDDHEDAIPGFGLKRDKGCISWNK